MVPGGVLTTLGATFLFQTYTNWHFAGYSWPCYVLAPAVGLFQLYLFGDRNRGLLIPVGVLTTIAACGFLGNIFKFINSSIIWPVVLVVVGLILLTSKNNKQ